MSILIGIIIFALIVGFLLFSQKQQDRPSNHRQLRHKVAENQELEDHQTEEESSPDKKTLKDIIHGKIKKTHILSLNEKQTFFRLKEALEPRYIVLAQVSFNALIWAGSRDIRNRFNRKMADFVIYDGNLNIIAVVDLDDASHQGQEQRDADRDCLLHEAGIKVIRYPRLPDIQQVQRDFNL